MGEGRERELWVPAVPVLTSLALSASTVGSTVYWQDSGFYLAAIRELAVAPSHGFVLYLLMAKAWTVLLFFVDFTLAAHLFSSVCAAVAAGVAALAARDFLRRFAPEISAGPAAAAAGCLLAGGYSFWNSALLAKAYALYYLTLALLLWVLVRAERRRDFMAAGALLGLAWAAHPSAALLVPAMLAYAWARRDRIREWGWGWFGRIVGLAAICALLPSLLLPVLAARDTPLHFGSPRTPGEIVRHLTGGQFVGWRGALGFHGARWVDAGRFLWEEYLGIGLVLLAIGLVHLWKMQRWAVSLLASWVAPFYLVSLLFVGEGMLDMWLVVGYVPLCLAVAAGLGRIGRAIRWAVPATAAAGLGWMVAANHGDLNLRGYDLAERFGRILLKNLPPGAVALLSTDDAVAIPLYLQFVRGERTDARIVNDGFLGTPWYDRTIERRYGLRVPDWERAERAMAAGNPELRVVTAVANENVAPGRPLYSDRAADERFLRAGLAQIPAGILWKIAVREETSYALKDWELGLEPEEVVPLRRRARGVLMIEVPDGVRYWLESYEDRLIQPLLQARIRHAEILLERGDPAQALALYDAALGLEPRLAAAGLFQLQRGRALAGLGRHGEAERIFRAVLEIPSSLRVATLAHYHLGETLRALGRRREARDCYERALRLGGANPETLKLIERRAREP